MKKIEKLLKQTADYFKDKLLTGDYKFIGTSNVGMLAEIQIDNYSLEVWTSNNHAVNFDFYFMDKVFNPLSQHMKFETNEERLQAWSHMEKYLLENEELIKKARIAELEKELKDLER